MKPPTGEKKIIWNIWKNGNRKGNDRNRAICSKQMWNLPLTPSWYNQKSSARGNKGGDPPGDYWQIDFGELPLKEGYRYVLVLVDTFRGWPESYACHTNTVKEVVKVLLNHMIKLWAASLWKSKIFWQPEAQRLPLYTHYICVILQIKDRCWGLIKFLLSVL